MQSKFVVLLCFVFPVVLASTCPDVKIPLPDPGKCWRCADGSGDVLLDGTKPGVVNWTDFYCKYSKHDPNYNPNNQNDPNSSIKITCTYNGSGDLIKREPPSQPCPNKATPEPAPCETPKRPPYHQGPFEDCCGTNCKKETDRCFHCPNAAANWVDVDTRNGKLECTYHLESPDSDQQHVCSFDGTTGKNLAGTGNYCDASPVAPQREECLKQHPEYAVKGSNDAAACAANDKECQQNAYTKCDYSCSSGESYCSNVCASDQCFTCPKIAGTSFAKGKFRNQQSIECDYYTDSKDGPVSGAICLYSQDNGALLDGGRDCPAKVDTNSKCQKAKPSTT